MQDAASVFRSLLIDAFEGPRGADGDGHSLLANLETVRETEWDTLPAGLSRSVRDIVLHVGSCKYMYNSHAFGDRAAWWDRPPVQPVDAAGLSVDAVITWLRRGQEALLASVEVLERDGLDAPVTTSWGETWPACRIFQTMIAHDYYHAGEINHLRGLIQGSDRWAFDE